MITHGFPVLSDARLVSLDEVASNTGAHPATLRCFVDFGLIRVSRRREEHLLFEPSVIPRVRMILRLRESLGINLAGISVILDMRERILRLQRGR
jgi:MerR family transcriptional regulator/heat shock protein HspR